MPTELDDIKFTAYNLQTNHIIMKDQHRKHWQWAFLGRFILYVFFI